MAIIKDTNRSPRRVSELRKQLEFFKQKAKEARKRAGNQ